MSTDLLAKAVAAHGGLDRWTRYESVRAAASIGGALWAIRLAARPPSGKWTFGWRRAEILSAAANGITLLVVAGNLALMAVVLLWPGNIRHAFEVKGDAAKWFGLSGLLVCLSQMFLYMAMSIAPVTVVSPINRTSILFRLYFSRWINPEHEVFGGSVIAGTVVSLAGAIALSLSVGSVQEVLPLPEPLAALLNWHWP